VNRLRQNEHDETCTCDELHATVVTSHCSTDVPEHVSLVLQSQNDPYEQQPVPPQVELPVESTPREQLAPSGDGVHENGSQLQVASVAPGQPYEAQHSPPPLMPAVLHAAPFGDGPTVQKHESPEAKQFVAPAPPSAGGPTPPPSALAHAGQELAMHDARPGAPSRRLPHRRGPAKHSPRSGSEIAEQVASPQQASRGFVHAALTQRPQTVVSPSKWQVVVSLDGSSLTKRMHPAPASVSAMTTRRRPWRRGGERTA
jgi:hypothetical protein